MYPCYLVATFEFSYQYRDNPRNRGKWQRSPENIKEANKQAKILVGRSLTMMNYITAMPLLVSLTCMSPHTRLLNFATFCAVKTPNTQLKHTTKNFARFHNHFLCYLCRKATSVFRRQVLLVDGEFRSRRPD